ncbi:unnamed protein product [Leptidea sinapis]|uniref:Major facilitator superfamily (MFS) profile domain-containing protein n=1 Tax=Leptidea sinapis TaxID=189913 RepID=A0A5E4R3H7_9NEOP|nr:unnamed protein product [Leptidea sinapis]
MAKQIHFEDALNLTGLGRFNVLMLMLNSCIVTAMTFELFSVSYLVPASACELNTTISQQGIMAGMPLMGIIASSNIWGYLADTRGRRKILIWSLSTGFLAGGLASFSPNWIVLSVLKFSSSTGLSASYPLAMTLLGETTPEKKRNILLSWLNTQLLMCIGIMAIISIPVLKLQFFYHIPFLNITFQSWRLLNLIFVLPCAIGAIGLIFSYESPKFLLKAGQEDKALQILKGIYTMNTGKSGDLYEVESVLLGESTAKEQTSLWSSFTAQTLPLFKPPLLKSTILLSSMFIIVYLGLQPFVIWMPYIADGFVRSLSTDDGTRTLCDMLRYSHNVTMTEKSDCSLNEIAMTSVFVNCCFLALLNGVLSVLINILGRKRLLIILQICSGIAGICLNFTHNYILIALLFTTYITSAVNFGFLGTFTVDIYPTYVKAMAVCITLMMGRGSSAIGINLLKSLLVYDCELAFYIYGSLTFFGGLVAFLLPSDEEIRNRKQRINDEQREVTEIVKTAS